MEAKVERGKITFTPKDAVESDIVEALEDFKTGQFLGPFQTAAAGIRALRRAAR